MVLDFTPVFDEFGTDFTAIEFGTGYYDYTQGGVWVPGEEIVHQLRSIITPLTTDDVTFDEGGTYTRQDVKIHYQGTLGVGWEIKYRGLRYKILEEKLYDKHANFNEYYARRIEEQGQEEGEE